MVDNALKWIRDRWWGLAAAYVIVFFGMYGILWFIFEPLNVAGNLNLANWTTWRVFYFTLTLLLGSHITLVLDLVFRRTRWAPRNIDPKELDRFRREMKGLLKHISAMPKKMSDYLWILVISGMAQLSVSLELSHHSNRGS